MTVITDQESERRIDRDIKDLVRYEANVSVRNNISRFGLADFNVRGMQGNRGRPATDPAIDRFTRPGHTLAAGL